MFALVAHIPTDRGHDHDVGGGQRLSDRRPDVAELILADCRAQIAVVEAAVRREESGEVGFAAVDEEMLGQTAPPCVGARTGVPADGLALLVEV